MPLAEDAARLAEKIAFFAELAHLEEDEHDPVDAGVKASMKLLQRQSTASSHLVPGSPSLMTKDLTVNATPTTSTSSLKMLGIAATPAQPDPLRKAVARSLIRSLTLPEAGVATLSTPMSQVHIVKDTPVRPPSVSAIIPQLRHSLSTPETMLPKVTPAATSGSKALGKRKRGEAAQVAEEHRLFSGLHFFFIPNDDIAAARRLRMRKAAEYGATRVTEWSSSISHVIVDKAVTYQDVLKYLRLPALPTDIVLVNESYPADCLSYRDMIPPDQVQYRVKGAEQATKVTAMPPPPSRTSSSDSSQRSLQIKAVHRKEDVTMLLQARTPSRTDESSVETFRKQVAEMSQPSQAVSSMSPGKTRKASSVADGADPLQALIEQARAGGEDQDFDPDEDTPDSPSDDEVANNSATSPPNSLSHSRKSSLTIATKKSTYACMRGGSVSKTTPNPNERTISVLQEMATMYDGQKDQWRTRAYRQAISTLRVQTHRITTAAEAKLLPNISDRLADKIEEIATTNKLRRLESAKSDPEEAAIRMFAKIYGVGLSQATKWVQAGYRSLEELLAANVPLSENQRIGIAHYDDFIARIPRAEVAMHGEIVRRALHAIDPSFEATVGGSYRRGAADSGDVDIVITKAGATAAYLRTVVIDTLVPELVKVGFLTAGLATTDKDSGSKWHGACQLPLPPSPGLSSSSSPEPRAKNVNTNPWRRIDLLLVPSDEIGAAMIYFTGNDIFNRSMRLLARRRGLRLNQRGLYKDVIRQGNTKLTEGVKIEGENEWRIFEVLGVPWREATERNC